MSMMRALTAIFFFLSGLGVCAADSNSTTQPTIRPDILHVMPAGVRLCFVARDMQSLITKVMSLQSQITGQPASGGADPLSMFTQMLGPSFDSDGSIAAVITGQGLLDDDVTDNHMSILLPARDSAKLSAIFNAKPGADGILQGTFPMGMGGPNSDLFIKIYPGYVAIAPTATAIKELQASGETLDSALSGPVQNKIGDSDCYFYINTAAITKNADQQINQAFDSLEQSFNGQMPVSSNQLKAVVDILRLASLQYLRDNQYGVVTFRMDNQGITLDSMIQFRDGSPTARLFEAQPALSANALAGLPDKDYVGVWTDSINGRAVYEWLNALIPASGPDAGEEAQLKATITKLLDADGQTLTDHAGDAMMVLPPMMENSASPQADASGTNQAQVRTVAVWVPGVIVLSSSSDAATEAGQIQPWVDSTIQSISAEARGFVVAARTSPDPLNIDGVSLRRIDLTISDAPPASTQPSGEAKTSLVTHIYYGSVSPNTVLLACNVDQDALQQTIENAKAGTAGVEKRPDLAQVLRQALPHAFFTAYVPLARLVLMMSGQQTPDQQAAAMPAGALALGVPPPPVVISAADIGTALDVAFYLPMDTLIQASKSGTDGNIFDMLF
jgi:hypothetical protein